MANPAEGNMQKTLSGPDTASNGAGFAAGKLSIEDAEKLADLFRPSWLLDDAPFAAMPANSQMNAAEMEALDGRHAGGSADLYAAPIEASSPHRSSSALQAPPPRTDVHEPENSVIIDRSITSADIDAGRAPAPAQAARLVSVPAQVAAPVMALPAPGPQSTPPRSATQQRPSGPVAVNPPVPVRSAPPPPRPVPARVPQRKAAPFAPSTAREFDAGMPQKSKTGLFVGIGAGALLLVSGIAIAVAMSSSSPPASTPSAGGKSTPTSATTGTATGTTPVTAIATAPIKQAAADVAEDPAPAAASTHAKPPKSGTDSIGVPTQQRGAGTAAPPPKPAPTKSAGGSTIVHELKGL